MSKKNSKDQHCRKSLRPPVSHRSDDLHIVAIQRAHHNLWPLKCSDNDRLLLQLKSTSDCHNQDKTLNDHTMRVLQDDIASLKFQLSEVKRRENTVR